MMMFTKASRVCGTHGIVEPLWDDITALAIISSFSVSTPKCQQISTGRCDGIPRPPCSTAFSPKIFSMIARIPPGLLTTADICHPSRFGTYVGQSLFHPSTPIPSALLLDRRIAVPIAEITTVGASLCHERRRIVRVSWCTAPGIVGAYASSVAERYICGRCLMVRTWPTTVGGRLGRVLGPAEDAGGGDVFIRPSSVVIPVFNFVWRSSVAFTAVLWNSIDSGSKSESIVWEQRYLINLKSAVPSRTIHQLVPYTSLN